MIYKLFWLGNLMRVISGIFLLVILASLVSATIILHDEEVRTEYYKYEFLEHIKKWEMTIINFELIEKKSIKDWSKKN